MVLEFVATLCTVTLTAGIPEGPGVQITRREAGTLFFCNWLAI